MRLVSKILMKIRIEMFECKGGIVSVLLLFTAFVYCFVVGTSSPFR